MKLVQRLLPVVLAFLITGFSSPSLSQEQGATGGPSKTFDYSGQDAGDCHLNSATLTLRSDGSGSWDARLFTHHTSNADIWHAQFYFNDSNNKASGGLPQWDSPEMRGSPSPEVVWHVDFRFDAASYNRWVYSVPVFNC